MRSRRLDSVVTVVSKRTGGDKDPSRPYVGLENIPSCGSRLLGTNSSSDSTSTNSLFEPGDILFGKLRPRLRKCVQVSFAGYCSTDILVLRALEETDPKYAGFLLQSDTVFGEAIRTEEGTKMPRCSWRDLQRVEVPVLDQWEQKRRAEILSSIDEAIEQTEALIAKTQQIKAGLLHDLFTRGVTPDGKLRPPREEAPKLYKETPIGWVPKEWEVELLDHVSQRGSGHTPNRNKPEYWNGGIKWVSLADSWRLDQVHISETDFQISQLGIENSSACLHPAGIVVLSRDAGVGKSAITTCEMAVSQHFMCWRCGPRLNNYFLYFWLQYQKRHFENIAIGSTIPTIGLRFFKHYRTPVPQTVAEQIHIVKTLLAVEETTQRLVQELSKLRQLKAGLMQDLLVERHNMMAELVSP